MNLEKYRILFVDEAHEHLAEMGRALGELDSGPEAAREAVDTLFRMTHSIKGMAASLDYLSVSTLAHRLEDWLEPMRGHGAVPDDSLSLLYEAVAALEEMVQVVERTGEPPGPREDLLVRLSEPHSRAAEGDGASLVAIVPGAAAPASAESADRGPPAPAKKARGQVPRLRSRARSGFVPRPWIDSSRRWAI